MIRFSVRRRVCKIWLGLAGAIVLVSAGPRADAQIGITLEGRVRSNQGAVIQGAVRLTLRTESGQEVGQQSASSDGDYAFQDLHAGHYSLTVSSDGFATYQQDVDLSISAANHFLDVYLEPAAPQGGNLSVAPARTDSEAPKKARKEEQKGARALDQHDYALAGSYLKKAVAIFPCYARAQASLALVEVYERDLTTAESALRHGIKCDRDFLESYLLLGEVLDAEGKYAEGSAILQEGLRRAPSSWQLHYQMGLTHLASGRLAEAEISFHKVKEFNASPPPQYYVKLADVYIQERAYPKAYGAMEDYLRAAPDGKYAARIKTLMQQMVAAGTVHPAGVPAPSPPKPASPN